MRDELGGVGMQVVFTLAILDCVIKCNTIFVSNLSGASHIQYFWNVSSVTLNISSGIWNASSLTVTLFMFQKKENWNVFGEACLKNLKANYKLIESLFFSIWTNMSKQKAFD
jgi:hypothetical protein